MTAAAAEPRGWIPAWSLADRLRKIRKSTNKTQREFAELLDVRWQTYATWEASGKPGDVVALAKRLELLTGVPAAWVLGVDMPAAPNGAITPDVSLPHYTCNAAGNAHIRPRHLRVVA